MWAKKWLLGRDRFTHLNLLNFIRNDSLEDYKNYLRMSDENVQYLVAKLRPLIVIKLALSVIVAVWIRESGLGAPTHVRAHSKPATSRAPSKALTSQARIGQVRLVTIHIRTSLTHWNPSPAGLASQTRTCMGTFRAVSVRWFGQSESDFVCKQKILAGNTPPPPVFFELKKFTIKCSVDFFAVGCDVMQPFLFLNSIFQRFVRCRL
jgi:hypothetical protein